MNLKSQSLDFYMVLSTSLFFSCETYYVFDKEHIYVYKEKYYLELHYPKSQSTLT